MVKIQKTFANDNPKLYLVATPIGNLEDITFRAINTLKMVDFIYCEDTRTSLKILNHYQISTPLKSFHLFNENLISSQIINHLNNGKNIAIISDAGMPIISDPGWIAVKDAIDHDYDVVVIPGASAGISAIIASGLPSYRYLFVGFLNSKKNKRLKELSSLKNNSETIILYESPHRITDTLELIDQVFTNRLIVIARELTKIHEEYIRGTARQILDLDLNLKGEIVIIIEGLTSNLDQDLLDLSISEHYQYYLDQDYQSKDALKQVALDRGVSKKEIYSQIFKKEEYHES